MLEHFGGNPEIHDHTVGKRPQRHNGTGRSADHLAGKPSHRQHLVGADIHRHHRRLTDHNALAFDVDQCVDRSQINADIF